MIYHLLLLGIGLGVLYVGVLDLLLLYLALLGLILLGILLTLLLLESKGIHVSFLFVGVCEGP